MTTPNPASRRVRANGDKAVYQRKDGRWEAAGYVLAPGNTRRRIRVYGTTRKKALAKLTEKIAASNRGIPVPSAQGSVAAYLTYWLETVAVHRLRENTHTRYTACVRLYVAPGLGRKKLAKTHRQGRPHLARPAPHHLPVLHTRPRHHPRPAPVLRGRDVLPQAAVPAHAGLRALRAQVRPGARRPRRGNPPQRRPQRPHGHPTPPAASNPSPPKKPAPSSQPPTGTG